MSEREKLENELEKSGCGCENHDSDHECDCGDDCGCGDEELQKMHIELDDGSELDCFVLGIFGVEDKEYIALVPEGEETVLLYNYVEEGEEVQLLNIEDDAEYNMVSEVFETLFMDEEDYEEESKETDK